MHTDGAQIISSLYEANCERRIFDKILYDVYISDDIETINKNTETLIDASKEFGLEVNVEKTKYVLV
jgi:hypothetical protein